MRGSPDKEHCTNMELRQSSGSGNLVAIEKKRKSDDFFGQNIGQILELLYSAWLSYRNITQSATPRLELPGVKEIRELCHQIYDLNPVENLWQELKF